MKCQGYIDGRKMEGSMRLLQLNPHGFGPEMNEKINMLKEVIVNMQIDAILFSAPDRKWSTSKVDYLKCRLSPIDKNIAIIISDTGQNAKTRSGFLPRGVVSIIKGQSVRLIDVEKEKHSKLGN